MQEVPSTAGHDQVKYKTLSKSFEKHVTKTEDQVNYKDIFTPKMVLLAVVVIAHICKKLKSVRVWRMHRLVCSNTINIHRGKALLSSQRLLKESQSLVNTAYTALASPTAGQGARAELGQRCCRLDGSGLCRLTPASYQVLRDNAAPRCFYSALLAECCSSLHKCILLIQWYLVDLIRFCIEGYLCWGNAVLQSSVSP